MRDQVAAEDAVQDTLLAALQGADKFEGNAAVRTWLVGILKHKIVDFFRRQSREQPLQSTDEDLSLDDFGEMFLADGHYREAPQDWTSPESSLDQRRFFEALERCLQGLPAKTARVFMMREVLGIETDEICKELAISSSNCWVLLYRARMALRVCLEKGWFGGKHPHENERQ